jgi:hypothetical protein
MTQTKPKSDTTSGKQVTPTATESSESSYFYSHFQQGGRHILIGAEGERVNVARLTSYAEYGEEVYGADVHHEIPLLKIDAPKFISPLSNEVHSRFHGSDPDPVDVDGFPLLRSEEGEDER